MSGAIGVGLVALIVALVVAGGIRLLPPRQSIPLHLKHHPLVDVGKGFLSEDTVEALLAMTRKIKTIGTAARDYDMYSTVADNIGEAVPFNKSLGKCPATFLMPNGDKTTCVIPGRADVGRHYVRSGGTEGLKERFDILVSRVQPFQKLLFDWSEHDVAVRLMADPKFVQLAKDVCPKDRQFLDPFQFNLVVQVPGQTVATHIDAPVFMHATRRTAPQWLLASMVFSGLFHHDYVNQVQLVGYYHKWTDTDRGGKFYFWNDDNEMPHVSDPVSGSANSVDGVKVIHAAALYMGHRKPPAMQKDTVNVLEYQGTDEQHSGRHTWAVTANGAILEKYDESEIRFSAVYRAHCFRDEAERETFRRNVQEEAWSTDHILSVFEGDMKARGVWPFAHNDTAIERSSAADRYELGLAIMDEYVKYPYSPFAKMPLNYCALDRAFPSVGPILDWVC
jgi:hypothetical protein